VEVAVKTDGMAAGPLSKSVTVMSNDPRQPRILLTVTAAITLEFSASERQIYFGQVPRGKEVVKEVVISIDPARSVKLLAAESTDQYVTVRLEPVPGSNGKKVKLVAVQKPDAKDGYHFGQLVIKTSSALTPELRIPVRGMVVPPAGN
jgi:hypothetical protein